MRAIPTISRFEKGYFEDGVYNLKGWFLKGIASNCFRSLESKQERVLKEWLWVVILSGSPRTPQDIIRGTEQ